ncbi:MAG: DinB family protein [Bryobacteraceae bacterium]
MHNRRMDAPDPSEYASYYGRYIQLVTAPDIVGALASQIQATSADLRGISEERSGSRYARGKWSIREVVGHMIDAERIFAYRALRFARGDQNALAGFEQDDYIRTARFDACRFSDLMEEFELVRRANIWMFRHLDAEAWMRRGVASGYEITVRALAFVIAGHELHHVQVLRERYLA